MDRDFDVLFNEDGVFVIITPGCDIAMSDVAALLKENGVSDYNGTLLSEELESPTGNPVKIAEPLPPKPADFRMQIANDALTCEIWVIPPGGGTPWPPVMEVLGYLQAHGVVYGHDEAAIKSMLDEKRAKQWVVVAKGLAPKNGKDAQMTYHVDLDAIHPKAVDNDRVDMKELGAVVNVLKGVEIATKTPAVAGEDGISVYGKKIAAYMGKDKNLPGGKGTSTSEDKLHLFADYDGNVKIQDGKLVVNPHYEVKGDVDYGIGNIDFVGPVTIQGSVREGFEVSAGSDLTIQGVVEGAELKSGSDIFIKIGVRGTGKAKISAKGNITIGYIDQAYVRAEGDVNVTDAILHSDVGARGTVSALSGKKGQIAGGKIQAGKEVVCETLGSEMGTKTEVIVGILPEHQEERKRCMQNLKEMEEQQKSVEANANFLKQLQENGDFPPDKQALLARITKAKYQLRAQIESCKKRLAELEKDMERSKLEGQVRVRNTCYSGVTVTIRGIRYIVKETLRFARFVCEDGEVKIKSFD